MLEDAVLKSNLQLPKDLVIKLITFIDIQKLKGLNAPSALSRFGDYLGFLQLPETQELVKFFHERWRDPKVIIEITPDIRKMIPGSNELFTPPRMEAVVIDKPYYKHGIPKTRGYVHGEHSLKLAPVPSESYKSFIIAQNLPSKFYLRIGSEQVASALENGLPAPKDQYVLFGSSNLALAYYLLVLNKYMKGSEHVSSGVTLQIDPWQLELNSDVLSAFRKYKFEGYSYKAGIPAKAIGVESKS